MLEQLDQIFAQIPPLVVGGKEYSPIFRYGTESQLAEDLSLKRKTGERYYPLIYLETPFTSSEFVSLRFILATLNKRTDMRNKDRMNWTFGQVLEPLREYIYHALLRSGIFYRTVDTPTKYYQGEYVFNYHITPDIWDALIYETTFRYRPDCGVKTIYFKTQ